MPCNGPVSASARSHEATRETHHRTVQMINPLTTKSRNTILTAIANHVMGLHERRYKPVQRRAAAERNAVMSTRMAGSSRAQTLDVCLW